MALLARDCCVGEGKKHSKVTKKHLESWKMVLKIGENAEVWPIFFSLLAPLQGVVLAQFQLETGDFQELAIRHTKNAHLVTEP